MDIKKYRLITSTLLLTALSLTFIPEFGLAKTSQEQAKALGEDLTPVGAEQGGNSAGTIPAWQGGITTPPPGFDPAKQHADPYASDKPLFTITAQNMETYKKNLSPGQIELLKTYPSFAIPVYPTRRSASYPDFVYKAIAQNALNAQLTEDGNGVLNASIGVPFPIPKSGLEVVFNHLMRWRGGRIHREVTQAVPTVSGDFTPITFEEDFIFTYGLPQTTAKDVNESNLLFYFKQEVTAPARLAGSILMIHETLDQQKDPRRAWVYNAGQRRVRRAPNVAYDNPGTASDGMRTTDNFDMYNGSPNRYNWTLVGKKEMYIPYNAYPIHSDKLDYSDILLPGHVNPKHTRYELHRVWEVVGELKNDTRHLYAKRVFYIDEDTWQIAVADHYDTRGNLWRVAEAHMLNYYEVPVPWHTLEVIHDLQARRYLVLGMDNLSKPYDFKADLNVSDFQPSALRRQGLR